MEILESAIRSFADEYINHPAGIEGNDSTDWCSFPLQVTIATRVTTRESELAAMDLDNIDNFDDNHTTQPDPMADRKLQPVSANHRPTMTLKNTSLLAANQVTAMAPTCNIAAGVPEWSSDTCCPRRPSWHYWAPPPKSCIHAETPPLSTYVCDFGQEYGMCHCPAQTQTCIFPPTCSECNCVMLSTHHDCPSVSLCHALFHGTSVHLCGWRVPPCEIDPCMCAVQPSFGEGPHSGYPHWNHDRTQTPMR
eukprot:2388897-Amphidinium_carterae.1